MKENAAKRGWGLVKATAKHWQMDNAPRLGAALAYYSVLAMPAILVILLYVVSLFYGSHGASTKVSEQISQMVGPQSSDLIQKMMTNPQIHGKGPMATAIAIVVFIVSATGFFVELQSSMNSAWGVEQRSDIGWLGLIVIRLISFALLLGIGILLMLSVVASAGLTAVQHAMGNNEAWMTAVWRVIDFVVSCGIITLLFAILFKFLPDAKVRWRDVWMGALVTAFLFTVGKFLIGIYLAHSSTASMYGFAGSLVLLLVWIYYSAQIFLFGVEFTQIYASEHGRGIQPSHEAQWKAQGQGAAEDRAEAATSGHPSQAASDPKQVAQAHAKQEKGEAPAPRQPARKPEQAPPTPQPAPSSARSADTVHKLGDRVHGWRSFLRRAKA